MSAAFTESLLAQLREHVTTSETAAQERYDKLKTETDARIAELQRRNGDLEMRGGVLEGRNEELLRRNAELEKKLADEKSKTQRAIATAMETLSSFRAPEAPQSSSRNPPYESLRLEAGHAITAASPPNPDAHPRSPASDLTALPDEDDGTPAGDDSASSRTLVEKSRRDKEELERLRKEVEELKSTRREAVVREETVTPGTTIHQSPRIPLESIKYVANILADQHHFGTLANLNVSCRLLRNETTPILERTLVLDGEKGWWKDGSDGSAFAFAGFGKKWKHTEFVISEPGELYKFRTTVFPSLKVWILKHPERRNHIRIGVLPTITKEEPQMACDVMISQSVTTSDLAYLLSTSLDWWHNGTKIQTPVQRIPQVLVEAFAFVDEDASISADVSFKLGKLDSTTTFKYLQPYTCSRSLESLPRTMILLDRLFIRECLLLDPAFTLTSFDNPDEGDRLQKTVVELYDGHSLYDPYLKTIDDRLQRGLLADITLKFPVRRQTGCNTNGKRKEFIIECARSAATTYQRHWSSLPKHSSEPTPARTKVTPIGQHYRPDPFLSVIISSTSKHGFNGFNIELHQKGNDLDGIWLDVLNSWSHGVGEVETGKPDQVYTRPSAAVHERYAVQRPV